MKEEAERSVRSATKPAGFTRHLLSILLLPVTVTAVIPGGIIHHTATEGLGWRLPCPFTQVLEALGLVAIVVGLAFMIRTVAAFARVGKGTLAPWDPPRELVVSGMYRYVRNPMITGVFFVLLGEAILFASVPLLCWFAFFAATNMVYIPLSEEPRLIRRFGDNYRVYMKHVPRWIPRGTPWEQS